MFILNFKVKSSQSVIKILTQSLPLVPTMQASWLLSTEMDVIRLATLFPGYFKVMLQISSAPRKYWRTYHSYFKNLHGRNLEFEKWGEVRVVGVNIVYKRRGMLSLHTQWPCPDLTPYGFTIISFNSLRSVVLYCIILDHNKQFL